jgi:hypothetical protein
LDRKDFFGGLFYWQLVYLVGSHARWRFIAADLVDFHALVADLAIEVFKDKPSEILCRRIQFLIKRRQLVDIAMIEIFDDGVGRFFQIDKIDQEADVILLFAFRKYLEPIIMAVKVLALSLVAAQLVRAREIAFDHYFVK